MREQGKNNVPVGETLYQIAARKRYLTYAHMLWLFVAGSLLGVIAEGVHCLLRKGAWQTHVVSLGLPLCVLYGLGAVGCYAGHCLLPRHSYALRFFVYAVVGTVLELLTGGLLEFGLGMRAWNYAHKPYNFRGYICLSASIGWGIVGLLFSAVLARPLERIFSKLHGKAFAALTVFMSVYLVADFVLTGMCLFRWSRRRMGLSARTPLGGWIDRTFGDAFMRRRFVEWRFLR